MYNYCPIYTAQVKVCAVQPAPSPAASLSHRMLVMSHLPGRPQPHVTCHYHTLRLYKPWIPILTLGGSVGCKRAMRGPTCTVDAVNNQREKALLCVN